jgi:nucleoside-diphosphate-sugar epimerase
MVFSIRFEKSQLRRVIARFRRRSLPSRSSSATKTVVFCGTLAKDSRETSSREGFCMARVLVTGGAGFIGSHLVEALLEQGHQVRVLDNFRTGRLANLERVSTAIEILPGDLLDREIVQAAVNDRERVFHLAALPSVARSVEDPLATHAACATGTVHLLDAARRAGVKRVIYASSSSVYGSTHQGPRRENEVLTPRSPYAASKLAGEHYCRSFMSAYGLETVVLRFFNVFGPRQDACSPYSGVVALFTAALMAGRTPVIQGDGCQTRDFTYVDDAVGAIVQAATAMHAIGGVYNVGTGTAHSILELVCCLNEVLGTQIEPARVSSRPGDVRHSQADLTRARADLGYRPIVSFVEGLRRTVTAQADAMVAP